MTGSQSIREQPSNAGLGLVSLRSLARTAVIVPKEFPLTELTTLYKIKLADSAPKSTAETLRASDMVTKTLVRLDAS